MSMYLWWIILSALTGNPLVAGLMLLVIGWTVDRFTLGLLPDPFRFLARRRRESRLRQLIAINPHDRQARRELADLLVTRRAYAEAITFLRPAIEGGDTDSSSVFTMGVACLGAGHVEQGEKLLTHLAEDDPDFRVGELDLALGRFRLKRKDYAGAKEALDRLLTLRNGSVEGRVLLAQALKGLGDDGAAALKRDEAWNEYVAAPRFQKRQERLWAWRARPSRPALYGAAIALGLFVFGQAVAPAIASWSHQRLKNSPMERYTHAPPGMQRPYPGTTGNGPDDE